MAALHSSPQFLPNVGNRANAQTHASPSPDVSNATDRRFGSGSITGSTSERILKVALGSFAGKGFEATSLDALARNLGITKQTFANVAENRVGLMKSVWAERPDHPTFTVDRPDIAVIVGQQSK